MCVPRELKVLGDATALATTATTARFAPLRKLLAKVSGRVGGHHADRQLRRSEFDSKKLFSYVSYYPKI